MRDDIEMGQQRGVTPQRSTESLESPSDRGRPIALLVHEAAEAPPHLDLFLAPAQPLFSDEERVLEAWRLPASPSELGPGEHMRVEQIGLHRGLYVRLRQPKQLSEGRGTVTPVLHGYCVESALAEGVRLLDITWSDGTRLALSLEPGGCPEEPYYLRRVTSSSV